VNLLTDFPGEIAALTAAFLWAVASVVYGLVGQKIIPLLLNFIKGIIAIAFILITLVWQGEAIPNLPIFPATLLLLSGAIGIGLGDTAYFAALNHLGARRTLLLETLAPPISAWLALIFIGEQLTTIAWCGIFLTLLGVAWVISERNPVTNNSHNLKIGIIWGLVAALSQAIGAVLSRFALVDSNISPLWSTLLRLVAGTVIVSLLLIFPAVNQIKLIVKTRYYAAVSSRFVFSGKTLASLVGTITLASFASTYLGIWLQQISLKFAPTGIAQTLLSTSPLFILPIALALGEKVSCRAILGVLIAVGGIGLLFIN
jgi:drug/metabolite transporter (DMT)-like permease